LDQAKGEYQRAHAEIDAVQQKLREFPAVEKKASDGLDLKAAQLERNSETLFLEQMPVCSIIMWPLAQKPPAKWRACNGDLITQDEAPDFCKQMQNTKWASEGGRVYQVPDPRGYFICGTDDRKADDPEKVDQRRHA